MAFLEHIKEDFLSRYGGGKAATAPANSLDKEFGYSIVVMIIGIMNTCWKFYFLVLAADIMCYLMQAKIEGTHAVPC